MDPWKPFHGSVDPLDPWKTYQGPYSSPKTTPKGFDIANPENLTKPAFFIFVAVVVPFYNKLVEKICLQAP